MDFLKSCTTNVRVVDNATSIPCEGFALDGSANEAERSSQLFKTISKLRAGQTLCSLHDNRLSVFGYKLEATKASLKQLGYSETEVRQERRMNHLLDAIEGSLAYKLAVDGLTHFAPWTWIFCDGSEDDGMFNGSTLIELRAGFGSNGALYISSNIRTSPLLPADLEAERGDSKHYVLAPSGKRVIMHPKSEVDIPTLRSPGWKDSVTEILLAEAVEISEDEQWVGVELDVSNDVHRFLWPARLCFHSSNPHFPDFRQEVDWRQWFDHDAANGDAFQDPLAAAEEWFTGATQRKTFDQVDDNLAAESMAAPATADITSELVTSPPFNQRTADQQAAMSGIYPTPPDGLLPGTQGTQNMPTSESNTMPPINETSELLPGDEVDGLRQSVSSSNAAEGGFQRSDDDLFGDMGEMDFGGNEVGDADFDYFDEPDEEVDNVPHVHELSGDIDMADASSSQQQQVEAEVEVPPASEDENQLPTEDSALKYRGTSELQTDHATIEPNDADPATSDTAVQSNDIPTKKDRPLSPFGIRERLLPPPIPASTVRAESENGKSLRRSSTFGPVSFNEGLGLATKYSSENPITAVQHASTQNTETTVSLPPKQKRIRAKISSPTADSTASDEESRSSDSEDYDSETSLSDAAAPGKLPWESKKRKRGMTETFARTANGGGLEWLYGSAMSKGDTEEVSVETIRKLHTMLLRARGPEDVLHGERENHARCGLAGSRAQASHTGAERKEDRVPPVDQLFSQLEGLDLVCIAQLISEQGVSVMPRLVDAVKMNTELPSPDDISSAIQPLFDHAINGILPATSSCDLAKLALPREPARQMPSQSSKGPHAVPRPPQRSESIQQGPDCCPIPSPYIRAQRYGDVVEMLPPALHFWSTLGLSPSNGGKDIRVVSILPENLDFVLLAQDFINELRLVYEANKLGSWTEVAGIATEDPEDLVLHDDSTVIIQPHASEDSLTSADVLQAYAHSCEALGKTLAQVGHEEADRTILVCIADPFSTSGSQQALCACFWMLYKAYRDNTPKAHRNAQRSDIVLRILPCELIVSPDSLRILDQRQYGQLAMEIYDRCPPSSKAAASKDVPAALMPYFAAPAVELAMPVPRRIPFQLSSDPPGDLLHENSVLHLAYAISEDMQWMCFSWVDASGRYQSQMSSCLRGKTIADAIGDAWERTGEWLRARDVTWRVYVVGCGAVDTSVRDCWKAAVSKKARRQPLHVTLLSVDPEPDLELTPPPPQPSTNEKAAGSGQGFLTPVTTPSGTGITVSPDASSAAPPTPAPSDPTPDNDADAHLVDIADESWGLMLSSAFASSSSVTSTETSPPLASGMLFRRGSPSSSQQTTSDDNSALEALAVSLHWDIRVRPNGTVDEGPARQAEFTLREVLRLYRNLALLGRARGLSGGSKAVGERKGGMVLPTHMQGVSSGVRALEGMLG